MAGTLFGLGLSQQFDVNGHPLAGALLYVYASGTSTPATTYEDFALSISRTFPIVADSAGRIPQFWVADGAYRARLTDAQGNEVFNLDAITAIGASSGTGGGTSVSATAIFQTGDPIWLPVSGARSGWVRANARTIGSSASGATERANADTQPLYEYLWANFSDTLCPVSGGRGGTSTADFNANKAIGTLDMRGRSAFGLDDMGNSAAGVLTVGTPTSAASSGGAEKHTIAQANLPNYNLDISGLTVTGQPAGGVWIKQGSNNTASGTAEALDFATLDVGGTLPSGGSGTALATTPPYRLGSWYLKLSLYGIVALPVIKILMGSGIA